MALLTGLLAGTTSPPPPPPGAPAEAQLNHDGYQGQDLWQAWSAWVRTRAMAERDAAFAAATVRQGWRHDADGPSTTTTTGYWSEGFQAGFVRLCEGATQACEWVYRSARLTADPDDFHALAAASFDGPAMAASLHSRGIAPGDLSANMVVPFPEIVDLAVMLEPTRRVEVVWEHDCPAVGAWQSRLGAELPLPLGPVAGAPPSPQIPPFPIHIRQIVDLPIEGYGGADVTVRVEGVRNRAVADLWQRVTDGIRACQ